MKVKTTLIGITVICCASAAIAKGGSHSGGHSSHGSSGGGTHHVSGHTTKSGTYVAPHRQTNPNHTQRDNWSSRPNVNPDTGKQGSKDPTH